MKVLRVFSKLFGRLAGCYGWLEASPCGSLPAAPRLIAARKSLQGKSPKLIVFILILMLVLPAADNRKTTKKRLVDIRENMFLTQISDIYMNFEDYENTIVRVQGMYTTIPSFTENKVEHVVYRRGPGCCGNDGWGGFLLKYKGTYPKENDWIEVVGTPELIGDEFYMDLYLNVTSLTVLSKRGAEFVTR